MEPDLNVSKSCQQHLALNASKIQENGQIKIDAASKLIAAVDLLLKEAYSCYGYEDEKPPSNALWPCEPKYERKIKGYQYKKRILEVSIFQDVINDEIEFGYICLNFPEGDHIYLIEEVAPQWIPKFEKGSEDNDKTALQVVCILLSGMFEKFHSFIISGKFRSREFSQKGIAPVFTPPKAQPQGPPKKEQKLNAPSSGYLVKEPKPSTVLVKLQKLFTKFEKKPNDSSRLFALIHESLRFISSIQSSVEEDEWPGGINYDSNVVQLWFTNFTSEGVKLYPLNVSLLWNPREFYLCLRSASDKSKSCIKKLSSSLVPSLLAGDVERDQECLDNINSWLTQLVNKFVMKVIVKGSSLADLSFESLDSLAFSSNVPTSEGEQNEAE